MVGYRKNAQLCTVQTPGTGADDGPGLQAAAVAEKRRFTPERPSHAAAGRTGLPACRCADALCDC